MDDLNLNPSEFYVGAMTADDGVSRYHLILLPGEFAGSTDAAVAWAAQISGQLPTRAEQRLMFERANAEFQQSWYWSDEPCAEYPGYTWAQDFYSGSQNPIQSDGLLARAVRRVAIS